MIKQNKIFCLMGPTAAGKTSLAIKITKTFPFDIVSVDSGMIYRDMDIGTAKPTKEELKSTPHRLIDICDPTEFYSAGQFRHDALLEIKKIFSKGRIPLLVGGTMLYFRVLQQGISNLPQANKEIRAEIADQGESQGWPALHQMLEKIDPKTAVVIKPTDSQRIQRALEVFKLTGKALSELQEIYPPQVLPYRNINIALIPSSKPYLDDKINSRFKEMLNLGFIEEVRRLFERGDLHLDLPSMRTVGYRQAMQYFVGQINHDQMLKQIPIATRQLAKRQLTWLRSWPEIMRFDIENTKLFDNVAKEIEKTIMLRRS